MKRSTSRELVMGWGRAAPTAARVLKPRTPSEIEDLVCSGTAGIARGLGRSYGDAAQCGGGVVIDCTRLDAIIGFDGSAARLRAQAGVSFDSLLKLLVPNGYFLPVTPGTRFVTLGGAIASDIHGKNHHVDGSIARYIETLTLVSPTGTTTCGPGSEDDVFAATCGGMGLTGVITEATLRLTAIETSQMLVDTERAKDLDTCMSLLAEERGRYRYSVAWVDGMASGSRLGRAVITRGDHAKLSDLPSSGRGRPSGLLPAPTPECGSGATDCSPESSFF